MGMSCIFYLENKMRLLGRFTITQKATFVYECAQPIPAML